VGGQVVLLWLGIKLRDVIILTTLRKEYLGFSRGVRNEIYTCPLWLSQGEVTAQTYMNFKTHKPTLAPQSRGVRISDVFAKTEEAALAAGKKVLKEFKEETKDIDLDSKVANEFFTSRKGKI